MPELPENFMFSERLEKLHASMDSSRVVSVCAPAGYGKTTLATSYFHRRDCPPSRICWYRLDPEDRNLPAFIAHFAESVFPSDDSRFFESRRMLKEYADLESQPQQAIAMICQEMWSHHSPSSHARTYIVLDDFQNVIQTPEICDMTRFMMDNLPPSCTIFVLNRTDFRIYTEKQKLEQKVLEIGAEDLAFSPSEVKDFMFHMDKSLAQQELSVFIQEKTEGWIAGIIILYQALKSKGPNIPAHELAKLVHEEALFRYLSLEVFESVEYSTQDALIRLALLQDFIESEAEQIFEITDIQALIAQSMGFGLFTQRIHGDPVVYRFHSLFREFLLHILKNRCSGELIAQLHLKAATYYIGQEAYIRAAEHLAKCGNVSAAIDIVIKAGYNKILVGETAQLKIWLDLLPEDLVRDNPVLLMYKAQLMPNSRQSEMVEPLKKILHMSLLDKKLDTYYQAASVLIYILMCSNDMKGLREIATGLPWQLENTSQELKNTLLILDMVRSIGEEQFGQGETQSETLLYDHLPEDSKWLYLILACIIYHCLGKLDRAEHCMQTALLLDNFKNIEPARGFVLLFLATTWSLKNEKERLTSALSEITAIGEKYDYDYLSANGRRLAAFERYLSFDMEGSVEMLDYAIFHYRRMNNNAMVASTMLLKRLWSIRPANTGNLEEARLEMAMLRKAKPGLMVNETALSILGAIARESGDFPRAERCLLSAMRLAKVKKGSQVLCGACFHLAKLYYVKGNEDKGHYYLQQAMELASENRYFMFWDIHIPTLTEMSLRSMRYGYCVGFAEELLSKFYDSGTITYLAKIVKTMDESRITAFVEDFVFRYQPSQGEQLYVVKAALFGTPEVFVNGIKIPDTEWKTKKVKGILEYLILNNGKTVSKDTLLNIFWPDSDSKSAMVSLRTALYQLRKTLSKYQVPVSGNNAFIHETLGGLQIRNSEILELDIAEFLRLQQELAALSEKTGSDSDAILELLEQMVSIYRGDLMEYSDYGDLVFLERERCKMIFEDICLKLGFIYEKRGKLSQAESIFRHALVLEPYSEKICLELLQLLMGQGRRSKAVSLYYRFKKRFEQDLDINIDSRLTEAVRNPGLHK